MGDSDSNFIRRLFYRLNIYFAIHTDYEKLVRDFNTASDELEKSVSLLNDTISQLEDSQDRERRWQRLFYGEQSRADLLQNRLDELQIEVQELRAREDDENHDEIKAVELGGQERPLPKGISLADESPE